MALLVPAVGEDKLVAFALGDLVPGDQTLKLYVNDKTPASTDTDADYTEMSTHGYAAKTLTKTSWVVAQSSGKAEGTYAAQTWSFTAAALVVVYGYFVVDSTSGVLLWAERFSSPKNVVNLGDEIIITPKFTLSSEN